jgi:protoporphyrinogen oxidase
MDRLDVAVIGAGASGAYAAHRLKTAHPEWSIGLFERTDRIGGRLWSLQLADAEHPIELGGMRFLTSHSRVKQVADEIGLETHPFEDTSAGEQPTHTRETATTWPRTSVVSRPRSFCSGHSKRSCQGQCRFKRHSGPTFVGRPSTVGGHWLTGRWARPWPLF